MLNYNKALVSFFVQRLESGLILFSSKPYLKVIWGRDGSAQSILFYMSFVKATDITPPHIIQEQYNPLVFCD